MSLQKIILKTLSFETYKDLIQRYPQILNLHYREQIDLRTESLTFNRSISKKNSFHLFIGPDNEYRIVSRGEFILFFRRLLKTIFSKCYEILPFVIDIYTIRASVEGCFSLDWTQGQGPFRLRIIAENGTYTLEGRLDWDPKTNTSYPGNIVTVRGANYEQKFYFRGGKFISSISLDYYSIYQEIILYRIGEGVLKRNCYYLNQVFDFETLVNERFLTFTSGMEGTYPVIDLDPEILLEDPEEDLIDFQDSEPDSNLFHEVELFLSQPNKSQELNLVNYQTTYHDRNILLNYLKDILGTRFRLFFGYDHFSNQMLSIKWFCIPIGSDGSDSSDECRRSVKEKIILKSEEFKIVVLTDISGRKKEVQIVIDEDYQKIFWFHDDELVSGVIYQEDTIRTFLPSPFEKNKISRNDYRGGEMIKEVSFILDENDEYKFEYKNYHLGNHSFDQLTYYFSLKETVPHLKPSHLKFDFYSEKFISLAGLGGLDYLFPTELKKSVKNFTFEGHLSSDQRTGLGPYKIIFLTNNSNRYSITGCLEWERETKTSYPIEKIKIEVNKKFVCLVYPHKKTGSLEKVITYYENSLCLHVFRPSDEEFRHFCYTFDEENDYLGEFEPSLASDLSISQLMNKLV